MEPRLSASDYTVKPDVRRVLRRPGGGKRLFRGRWTRTADFADGADGDEPAAGFPPHSNHASRVQPPRRSNTPGWLRRNRGGIESGHGGHVRRNRFRSVRSTGPFPPRPRRAESSRQRRLPRPVIRVARVFVPFAPVPRPGPLAGAAEILNASVGFRVRIFTRAPVGPAFI